VLVILNERLDWRGVPIIAEGGKAQRIALTEIFRSLEPLNAGREMKDRITYHTRWIHFRRHYSFAGKAAYWNARTYKQFKKALGG
jgi:hypothetical protein